MDFLSGVRFQVSEKVKLGKPGLRRGVPDAPLCREPESTETINLHPKGM